MLSERETSLRSALSLLVAMLLLLFPSQETKAQAGTARSTEEDGLIVTVVQVVATNRNVLAMPKEMLETAVVDGRVSFVVATDGKRTFEEGIPPELIVGFLANPKRGIVEGNVVRNPMFMQLVWEIAARHRDDQLDKTIVESEAKASCLIDMRARNPSGPIRKLIPDIIGIYSLEESGEILFEPNSNYRIVTKDGLIKLTPFIVKEMFSRYE